MSEPLLRAETSNPDPEQAARELHEQLRFGDAALTVLFCSPQYDVARLQPALKALPGSESIIGCTSAGEIGAKGYQSQSITGFSLAKSDFCVAIETIENVKDFSVDQAKSVVAKLRAKLDSQPCHEPGRKCFAFLLVDGLSIAEEPLTYKLQDALREIPLVGGSAGDGLDFRKTYVLAGNEFASNAAALAIVQTGRPWELFHEHTLDPTDTKLVVTESSPERRIVHELNGEPAAEELARVIGVKSPAALTSAVLAQHPLMISLGGNWYIRSAHTVNPDNSLSLFCGIEEGLVLTVGKARDLTTSLDVMFQDIRSRLGEIRLAITCDCILRRLELEGLAKIGDASQVLSRNNAIGFSTYGEQFGTLHVNQTLTGIAIG